MSPLVSAPSDDPQSYDPLHVAIIMDGNGRWAKRKFLPRVEGHRAGAKTVRLVVEESKRLKIRFLTLFAFSTENWLRPKQEISALMQLFCQFLKSEVRELKEQGVRLRAIGDFSKLSASVLYTLEGAIKATETGTELDLILAVSYGGRAEIAHAARELAKKVLVGEMKPDEIDEAAIAGNLYAPDIPVPDLLIRTGNEFRVSNFLLWQLAYSEIVISKFCWPDFSAEEFHRCISEYRGRDRRFGMTDEQSLEPPPV